MGASCLRAYVCADAGFNVTSTAKCKKFKLLGFYLFPSWIEISLSSLEAHMRLEEQSDPMLSFGFWSVVTNSSPESIDEVRLCWSCTTAYAGSTATLGIFVDNEDSHFLLQI